MVQFLYPFFCTPTPTPPHGPRPPPPLILPSLCNEQLTCLQVHYTWPNGKGSLLVGVEPTRPSYARLVEMLKVAPNTRASRSWVDRVLDINNLKGMSHMAVSFRHMILGMGCGWDSIRPNMSAAGAPCAGHVPHCAWVAGIVIWT